MMGWRAMWLALRTARVGHAMSGYGRLLATGIVWSPDGVIVTAHHLGCFWLMAGCDGGS
jgi:hypothetical protein